MVVLLFVGLAGLCEEIAHSTSGTVHYLARVSSIVYFLMTFGTYVIANVLERRAVERYRAEEFFEGDDRDPAERDSIKPGARFETSSGLLEIRGVNKGRVRFLHARGNAELIMRLERFRKYLFKPASKKQVK